MIVRAPRVDDGRGNEAWDWANAVERESEGWAVDVGAGSKDTQNRDGDSIAYTIRGPLDADLRATDRVRLYGVLHEVTGGVGRQMGATARTSHTVAALAAWEG
ncbi:hypothetical protein IT882_13105 [Microbacterium schleiferi]|uniref:Uncharacterized protein n=1 Tax=Microbacterium schleiferi TaxID=69362 RepID=A0A7S8MVQ3_9MICO|nr:hypothetical protein [Microbacterium schleiferi]QPE04129.1 hypothetical protein IT882_13105 [Microbacterium schleiferi]